MSSRLFRWELKKICAIPMFWIFITLCVGFNSILVFSGRYDQDYVSYVAEVTNVIGGQMGSIFDDDLDGLPDDEYKEILVALTLGAEDNLEGYSAKELAEYYIRTFHITGVSAELLEHKFELLQESINNLADNNASLSLAIGRMTQQIYENLFGSVCRFIVAEGMILAVLLALYSSGCEGIHKTASVVYTSRTGRRVQKCKLAAGVIASLASYAVIAILSVLIFSLTWQLGPIWNASMSTQFYSVNMFGIVTPFISWVEFSVAWYLAAILTLGSVLVAIFSLIGFSTGLITGNMYHGFLVFLLFVASEFGLIMLSGDSGNWPIFQLVQWTPIPLWMALNSWFTGLGLATVIPYQECWSALLWVFLSSLTVYLFYHRFLRKDVKELAA